MSSSSNNNQTVDSLREELEEANFTINVLWSNNLDMRVTVTEMIARIEHLEQNAVSEILQSLT